jgi:hypothetical protein
MNNTITGLTADEAVMLDEALTYYLERGLAPRDEKFRALRRRIVQLTPTPEPATKRPIIVTARKPRRFGATR